MIQPQNPDQWIEDLIADRKRLREENVAQAATIRERDETIRKLEIIKTNYRLSDNGRELESLRAQNAAQAEEIKRITERAVQVHLELEHKHAAESAELRARCERYEGLMCAYSAADAVTQAAEDLEDNAPEIKYAALEFLKAEKALSSEARSIRARKAEKQ